jgi:acyl-CoA thioester hydrolase
MQTYRVCFGDTDAGGIVYHARYFEMAERSRNETLRDAGVPIGDLFLGKLVEAAGDGIALVLHRGTAKFDTPAFVDDLLTLRSGTLKVNAARSWWRTVIGRGPGRYAPWTSNSSASTA